MKTKRRLLAFFFSVLLICQGCFPAKAEEKTPSVFVKTEIGSREEEDSREVGVLGSIREINEGTDAKSEEDRNSNEEALVEEESNLGTMAEDGNAAEAVEGTEEDRNAVETVEGTETLPRLLRAMNIRRKAGNRNLIIRLLSLKSW